MDVIIREEMMEDKDFLDDMRYEAIYILESKPSKSELLSQPSMRKYFDNWGRKGDTALIAIGNNGERLGAVWYRLFSDDQRGYGYIDSITPELGIGVISSCRGQGVGELLMRSIIQRAKEDGFESLSLSVDSRNRAAINLYMKTGFRMFDDSSTSWTMLLNIE